MHIDIDYLIGIREFLSVGKGGIPIHVSLFFIGGRREGGWNVRKIFLFEFRDDSIGRMEGKARGHGGQKILIGRGAILPIGLAHRKIGA